jgi:hypothetical protein
VTVQNLALTRGDGTATTLAALLAESDSRALRFVFGDAAAEPRACERLLRVGHDLLDPDGRLASHLGIDLSTTPSTTVLVRPDGYRSA